jgi:arylsulfatase A-like enzyme
MIRNDDAADYGRKLTETEYAISPEMTIGLDVCETILPQPLKQSGYTCGVIGKWDSGRARRFLPLQRGFDFFYGFANTGIDYWTHERYGIPSLFRDNERIKEEGYATDLFCREALNFIRANSARPFFLYLPFNACHGSAGFDHAGAQAPPETIAKYPANMDLKRKTRYACLTRMDEAIGQILDQLEALKIADNTLVIFFSDNGRLHRLDQSGVRVPCIARWPGQIPAGTTNHEFVTSLEILPTLLAAAGAQPPSGVTLDGFDMRPVLAGKQPSPRQEMFWHERENKAVRVGNYKWVESDRVNGLFDLSQADGEKHDLSAAKPELVAQLKARFVKWQQEMDESEPRGPFRNY